MDLFVSRFLNKLDKKGRVSFPSIFRNVLPPKNKNEIILFRSLKHNSIEGCSINRMATIAQSINNLEIFSDDQDDFSTSIFSEIVPTNLDKEGRFLIAEHLKKHAGIINEAVFVGQGHYFQIWEPEAAKKRQEQSRQRLKNQKKTLASILISKGNKDA
jgi:MraZ protein